MAKIFVVSVVMVMGLFWVPDWQQGQGQALFGTAVAGRMMRFFQTGSQLARQTADTQLFPDLTEREREVLELIARGKNNSDIAELLVVSPKTVRNHITNIFSKLQVADRAEDIVKARDAGLGHP